MKSPSISGSGAFSIGVDQPIREGDTVKVEEFTATVEHQVSDRLGVTLSYFRRKYYDVYQAVNAALSDADERVLSRVANEAKAMCAKFPVYGA